MEFSAKSPKSHRNMADIAEIVRILGDFLNKALVVFNLGQLMPHMNHTPARVCRISDSLHQQLFLFGYVGCGGNV